MEKPDFYIRRGPSLPYFNVPFPKLRIRHGPSVHSPKLQSSACDVAGGDGSSTAQFLMLADLVYLLCSSNHILKPMTYLLLPMCYYSPSPASAEGCDVGIIGRRYDGSTNPKFNNLWQASMKRPAGIEVVRSVSNCRTCPTTIHSSHLMIIRTLQRAGTLQYAAEMAVFGEGGPRSSLLWSGTQYILDVIYNLYVVLRPWLQSSAAVTS